MATTTDPVKLDPAQNTVKLDSTQNTVKLDPANSVVKAEVTKLPTPVTVTQSGTVAVTGSVEVTKLPAVTGSVEVTKLPAQPAPVVNVPAPVVNVPAPVVNVPAAVVNVPAPVVNVPAPVVNVPAPVVNVPPLPAVVPVRVDNEIVVTGLAGLAAMRQAVMFEGGRTGFGATTGSVGLDDMPTAPPGVQQSRDNPVPVVVALFVNPADSGVDANLQRISLGSSGAGEWTRLGWPDRIELVGPPQNTINRGQGTNTSKSHLYAGNNGRGYSGRRAKTTFQKEWSTIDDEIGGTIICRPGMSICWIFELSYGSGERASVEVVWWETPAAVDR